MSGHPIWIPCEGSRHPGHIGVVDNGRDRAMCAMCGAVVDVDDDWRTVDHKRDDVLARIERGDFT